MKHIETVLGPINEDQLGKTLMHEHCLVKAIDAYTEVEDADEEYKAFLQSDLTAEIRGKVNFHMHKHISNAENQDEELTVKELKNFKKAGGGGIADVTPPGIGRDINALVRVSKATGLNIIASTGLYIEPSWPEEFRRMNQHELRDFFLREINEGIEGTDVKAGYIGEIGMNDAWTEKEVMCLKAAGEASRESGLSMTVHQPIFRTFGERILDILEDVGVDPKKVVLSHCDPTINNLDYHLCILNRGATIQLDEFQMEFPCTYGPYVKRWLPRDIDRIRHIKRLCDAGFENQITVSYDMGGFKSLYKTYGGGGYGYLLDELYEYFLYEGITEAQMNKILEENPRRILAR